MEDTPQYGLTMLVVPPTAEPTLGSLLTAFQAQANEILAVAGYPTITAQVHTSLGAGQPNFSITAPDPSAAFGGLLSWGQGMTPDAALNEFISRIEPAGLSTGLVKEAA